MARFIGTKPTDDTACSFGHLVSSGGPSAPDPAASAGERDASSPRTRTIISLATKVLKFHDLAAPGARLSAVAAKWVVSVKTCRTIWKNRDALLRAIEGNKHMAGRARLTPGWFPALDSALSSYATRLRELRIPLTFGILKKPRQTVSWQHGRDKFLWQHRVRDAVAGTQRV